MQRFDLRYLKDDFFDKMLEIMDTKVATSEVAIILFEIGNFDNIQKSADVIRDAGYTLLNSLKFNEVDWTLVIKKEKAKEVDIVDD